MSGADLLSHLRRLVVSRQGAAIATLNLDHVVKLGSNQAFRAAYAAHDLVTADGFPIVLAGRLRGVEVVRTAGSDLIDPIARLAAELGCSIALVGSTEGSLGKAADRLQAAHPGLNVALQVSPAFGFNPAGPEADQIARRLRDSGAQICFIALGAPKQEIFAARLRTVAPEVCIISIGAALDFISGHQTRAPRVLQRFYLEWAWRLAGDPRRLAGRYVRSAFVLPRLLLTALRERRRA